MSSAFSLSFLTLAALVVAGCGEPYDEHSAIPVVAGEPVTIEDREALAVSHGFETASQLAPDDWVKIAAAQNMRLVPDANEETAEHVFDEMTEGNWEARGNFSECSCLDPSRVRRCSSPGVCWCAKKSGKFKFVTCKGGMAWCPLYKEYRC